MKFVRYKSRIEAGILLLEFIKHENERLYHFIIENKDKCFCYAIPNGGVPVCEGFCSQNNLKYDILIVRKIKIPNNTEAGFGSVTTDGTILINEPLLSRLNLSGQAIRDSIELTKSEIRERLKFYYKKLGSEKFYANKIQKKHIFILDDGLASGFTMLAAINMIKKYNPEKIYIAVPTAPLRTVRAIQPEVDKVFCPNVREVMRFAVAEAYKDWYDVTEAEVQKILNDSKYYLE